PRQQVGPARGEELLHLLALDRLLQDHATGAKVAAPLRPHGVLAGIRHAVLEDAARALRAGPEGLLAAEVGRFLPLAVGLPEVELRLEIVGEPDDRAERLAHPAAKAAHRANGALRDELGDLFRRPLAARGDFPEREVALLALELAVIFLHDPAALRARRGHGRVHDVRNLAGLDDRHDLAHELGNLLHELFARQ